MEDNDVNNFYTKQEEPNQSCFLALRLLIKNTDEQIEECIKYGCPCFLYKKKILCYLWKDISTQYPYILFSDGLKMKNKALEFGGRKKMKSFSVNPNLDLDALLINELIVEALDIKNS